MYELTQVSESCWFIQSPTKIGVVKTGDDEVCLIDSGNDRDAGKKVYRILQAQGWRLKAVYNTHAHADHIGGNKYLQTQTGCALYAPEVECAFAGHPILEPTTLYGGNPPGALRHKFLVAQESGVLPLAEGTLPAGWSLIPLPGHAFNMVGFRTPEDVVFLADSLTSAETLEKYQISFLTDVGKHLETLEAVKALRGRCFIPAHAGVLTETTPLAQANIEKIHEIADRIVGICRESVGFDEILKALFDGYGLEMTREQHALVGSTVRSYLTWLEETGRLEVRIDGNMMAWRRV